MLLASLNDFAARVNTNPLVQKMLKDWDRNILISVNDTGKQYTISVKARTVSVIPGDVGADIVISGGEEVLTGIFCGRLNPVREYSRGNVNFRGSAKDEMKVDAVIQMVWG